MSRMKTLLAGSAAAAVVGCGGYALGHADAAAGTPVLDRIATATGTVSNPEPSGAPSSGRALPSFAALAEQVAPSVVFIKSVSVEQTAGRFQRGGPNPFGEDGPLQGFPFPFPPGPPGGKRQGTGSGFVVREDGLIVTNNHVVENAKQITVTLGNEREYAARVLGRDPKTDLAVIKIETTDTLPAAKLGDSDSLRVGDWVMAIGNPFGLSNSVTAGIVSAKGRAIGAGPYDDFIQTDASINPGNSGGPLFNERGEAVGINTAIFSQSGGNIGIGFAVPINLAKQVLPELEAHGHVTRGWLGVAVQKVTPELARSLDLTEAHGALVADVTDGAPAAKAGLKRGDVIVSFNGKTINEVNALPALVAATPIGQTVPVEVIRERSHRTFEVTVAKLADETASEAPAPKASKWGLGLRDLEPQERERAGLEAGEGVLVTEVLPDSPAEDAGVQPGDIILQVNQKTVGSISALKTEVAQAKNDRLLLLLRHNGEQNRFAALVPK